MRMRVAAYALITRGEGADREILLPHWRDSGMSGWTLPGGGVEPGEHPADGAVREVKEETGYDARLTGLLGVDSAVLPSTARGDDMQALRILYRAEILGGELTVEVDGTTDDVAWHRVADVADLRRVHAVDWAISHIDDAGSPLR
ncbi:ADP-ribose pyrophosphatase YjhB, NUDIX family [Agrococcus baldri]|uniref:ADP-ribose pyrophosphatase YjhB, NUDIX family n=1 Tax=Agrococcus baldri TaxID=153730 RepID=A0AA94HMC8_9MICO|nr:NUDIX domain-containing protein [Agrococcus baldri]SFS10368.1 ADP-ribose pyrophosphatase YjhB, NUDIX family [Agrococcus baldri]